MTELPNFRIPKQSETNTTDFDTTDKDRYRMISPKPKENENFEHNWLYSVVPARMSTTNFVGQYQTVPEVSIYLAGYCRNCRKAFSVPIPFGADYQETQLSIPKFGCVSPFAGL